MIHLLTRLSVHYQTHSTSVYLLLKRLALLLASILFGLFIWGGNQPEAAGLFKAPWDKLAHLSWFAVLAGLLAFGLGPRARLPVALFCIGVALWDEWRQLTLPGRSAEFADLIFDGCGILIGIVMARSLGKKLLPHPRAKRVS